MGGVGFVARRAVKFNFSAASDSVTGNQTNTYTDDFTFWQGKIVRVVSDLQAALACHQSILFNSIRSSPLA